MAAVCEVSEVVNLRVRDIDGDRCLLRLVQAKGAKDRMGPCRHIACSDCGVFTGHFAGQPMAVSELTRNRRTHLHYNSTADLSPTPNVGASILTRLAVFIPPAPC